jgi:hypothetical protein
MNENGKFALVKKTSGAIEKAAPGAKRILSGMTMDALALAVRKFQIGEDELREPDYLQLTAWAEQLKMTPIEVLRRLKEGLRRKGDETRIENRKFTKLNWDAGLLPISDFQISFPLELTELSFAPIDAIDEGSCEDLEGIPADGKLPDGYCFSARVRKISAVHSLPKLRRLDCGASVGLEALAIAMAPALEHLDCSWNRLSTLDLISFPNLKELLCGSNYPLKSLDLKPVPQLLELDCSGNLIKKLDLHLVPKLRKLNCSDNDMQELILPNLPDLIELDCVNTTWDKGLGLGRYLEKIDLRGAPSLKRLNCHRNLLEHLDLSCVPRLTDLNCYWNPLIELDITPLKNLKVLKYDAGKTQLIQRPDQNF